MFGNQNSQPADDNHIPDQTIDGVVGSTDQSDQPSGAPSASPGGDNWQHPGVPVPNDAVAPLTPAYPADTTSNPTDAAASPLPSVDNTQSNASTPPSAPAVPPSSPTAASADDLIDIKQQALSQLSPLVDHLDQTPEEKFRTTMMLIQATDDQSKVQDAYAAAQQITDEKVRAQALLDIVNEINYFTQHHQNKTA